MSDIEHPAFTTETIASAQLYANLMGDTKVRIDALRNMLTDEFFKSQPDFIAMESCYLQMRLITELIARACIVAHMGSIKAKRKWFRKGVHADEIMDRLAEINPEFYPIPERHMRNPDGTWQGHFVRLEGFITRKRLTRLYSECGGFLHVGNVKTITEQRGEKAPIEDCIRKLLEDLGGIVRLLEWHTIVTADPAIQLFVEMAPEDDGKPIVRLIRVMDQGPEFFSALQARRAQVDRHG